MSDSDSLPLTMPRLLAWAAARNAGRVALEEDGIRLDFASLDAARRRAARAFIAAGTAHGDRVAIWAPNRHEWVVAATGAQSVGAMYGPMVLGLEPRGQYRDPADRWAGGGQLGGRAASSSREWSITVRMSCGFCR